VKESRKGEDPLRFGQSPCEDGLQHEQPTSPMKQNACPTPVSNSVR